MAMDQELRDAFIEVNGNLHQIHNDDVQLSGVSQAIQQSVDSVGQGIQTLVGLQSYANEALTHLTTQQDTIICILEKISQQTCALLNEAHRETGLQTEIREDIAALLDLSRGAYPQAALELARMNDFRRRLAECCPAPTPEPVCTYQPCPSPGPLRPPDRPS